MLNLNLIKLTNRLTRLLFNIEDKSALKLFVKKVILLLKNNGTLFTVKYMKQVKLHITRYMVGKPLLSNNAGVSLVGGFPLHFLYLRPYIDRGQLGGIKFVLTLLNISRSIRPKRGEVIPVDLSTIVLPNKGTGYIIPTSFVVKFCDYYDLYQSLPTYSWRDFTISLKAGPSGPSLATALYSFSLFSDEYMEIVRHWTGKFFAFFFEVSRYARFYNFNLPTKDMSQTRYIGRLSIVKDPDCKMRVIAILDYVSQFLLKPVHTKLFEKLNNFPCDRTFTQDPRANWLDNSEHFWSLDLSAATDRLPISLQEKLIGTLFRDMTFASEWRSLLQREYCIPTLNPEKSGMGYSSFLGLSPQQFHALGVLRQRTNVAGNFIKYEVGQPMGAYSSWASLAVTHHLIVQWSAYLCGKGPGFNQYILLGDDIVIKDNEVALKYMWVMRQLGVDISETKTHVSKNTYEFAKRWIRGSNEVTGIPLSGISDNINSVGTLITILHNYVYRGNLYLFKGTFSELVIRALSGLKVVRGPRKSGLTQTYLKQIVPNFVTTLRYTSGLMTREEERNLLLESLNQEVLTIPGYTLIPQFMRAVFTEEVVKLSVLTSYKYLDFKENLEKYASNLIRDISWPGKGQLLSRLWPFIKWMPLDSLREISRIVNSIEETHILLWNREDLRHFQYQFSWYAIQNHIQRVYDRTKEYILGNSSSDLINIVKNLSYLDFDEIAATERDVQKVIESTKSLLFSSLQALELRRRLVAVNNNMEYILSEQLVAFVNYKSRGYGTDQWTEPERKLSLWAPLARLDRELGPVVVEINQLNTEVFRLPEPLPMTGDW